MFRRYQSRARPHRLHLQVRQRDTAFPCATAAVLPKTNAFACGTAAGAGRPGWLAAAGRRWAAGAGAGPSFTAPSLPFAVISPPLAAVLLQVQGPVACRVCGHGYNALWVQRGVCSQCEDGARRAGWVHLSLKKNMEHVQHSGPNHLGLPLNQALPVPERVREDRLLLPARQPLLRLRRLVRPHGKALYNNLYKLSRSKTVHFLL